VGDDGDAIVSLMLQVMLDERERTRDRLDAARFLADRGWGKPMQALDVEVAPQGPLVDPACLARLSRDDLETMIALLEKAQLLEASGAAELADGSPGRGAQAPNQRSA
jgi:hypothetical protein